MINKTGTNPKGDVIEGKSTEPPVEVDYQTMGITQLQDAIGKCVTVDGKGKVTIVDRKLLSKLSAILTAKEAEAAKAERELKLKALVEIEDKVKDAIANALKPFIANKSLEGADGVWFAWDFGEKLTTMRLMKGARKATGEGVGSGNYKPLSSFSTNSKDLLAKVGSRIYIKEDTTATIDKKEHNLKKGMTYQQAFDFSTNGGWRNRITQALLKEAGLI